MNALGQMAEDIALAVHCDKPVYTFPSGMTPAKEKDILAKVQSILEGKEKEAF